MTSLKTSIKTITYLSDIGCLEIQGASLVTACVSGVAHTYMAAERLEKLCLLEKWGVSIETQGALGKIGRAHV